MEVRNIPERKNWREKFAGLGLAYECEDWADDIFCVVSPRELDTLRNAAEQVSARMKGTLERCFTERRLKAPWQLDPVEEAAIRGSFSNRMSMAVQKIDFVETRNGVFALTGIEVDPVEGFLSCALMQWLWIDERLSLGFIPSECDQFNRLNEVMLAKVRRIGAAGKTLHALFDIKDRASAAMAGYVVNLGIQASTEIRPIHHASIAADGNSLVDPSGTPVDLCWRSRFPGSAGILRSQAFTNVEFTTPAWYTLLPSVFEKMSEIAVAAPEVRRRYTDGTTAVLSIWLVNSHAVAASCEISEADPAEKPKRAAHVVR
jgi:glutathionylspermidine synthase|nr:glutathionylspermidine synthase family protein [Neorhizobium tomejilense]